MSDEWSLAKEIFLKTFWPSSVPQESGRPLLQGAFTHAGLLGAGATQGQSALTATRELSDIFLS